MPGGTLAVNAPLASDVKRIVTGPLSVTAAPATGMPDPLRTVPDTTAVDEAWPAAGAGPVAGVVCATACTASAAIKPITAATEQPPRENANERM